MSTPEETVPGGALFKPSGEPTYDDVSEAVVELLFIDGVRFPFDPENIRKILGYGTLEVIAEKVGMLLHGPSPDRDWIRDNADLLDEFYALLMAGDLPEDAE